MAWLLISAPPQSDGEDEQAKARREQQETETREWLSLQISQKQTEKQRELQRQQEEAAVEAALQRRAGQLQQMQQLCRQAQQLACDEANAALASDTAARLAEERRLGQEAERRHVEGAVRGSLLTEDPAAATSRLGPHRVLVNKWKGFSPEQRQQQLDKLESQIRENKARQELLQKEQKEWEAHAAHVDEKTEKQFRIFLEEKRRQQAELLAANKRLAEQQRLRRLQEHQLYGTNQPTEDYFDGFGVYAR
ncbi:RIB43A-like with coiled-coils protein 2 [Hyalella azteca]|uniref:RIB43A-like with coiled-coils protein 2 n=1 Tax=Hyalella azteca TaxID=294128 RepID=A0A979FPX3_HYAAZ|nr:RIB43A-like with coiled-coils protein 2 [Hyalella azteca]